MNWAPAKRLVRAIEKSLRGGTALTLRLGLELLRLKSSYPETRGVKPKEKNPHSAGFSTWEETVQRELGISDDTAQRWMRAARGFLSHCKRDERWWLASKADQKAMFAQLEEVTKGATLKQLATEWQRMLEEAATPDPLGNGGGSEPVPQIPVQLEMQSILKAATKEADRLKTVLLGSDLCELWGDVPLFAFRPKDDVRAELARLQAAVKLRQTWLNHGDEALRQARAEMIEQAAANTDTLLELEIAKVEAERQRKAAWRAAGKALKEGRAA